MSTGQIQNSIEIRPDTKQVVLTLGEGLQEPEHYKYVMDTLLRAVAEMQHEMREMHSIEQ